MTTGKSKSSGSLKDKICVITGGAGLLGTAFSRAAAAEGAVVVVVDIDPAKGEQTVKKIKQETGNKQIIFERCDITNEKEINQLVAGVIKKFGRIDALVNNAYPRNKNFGKKFEEKSYVDFCENVDTHLGGYFLMARVFSETMKKQKSGIIINMGSIYGFAAPRFEIYEETKMTVPPEYAAIKGGVINLTRYLASYLGKYNIRVNAVSPGGIFDHQPESFVKKYTAKVPLGGRMGEPKDIAGVVVFLLSDAAKYITGRNIVVDGGWTL